MKRIVTLPIALLLGGCLALVLAQRCAHAQERDGWQTMDMSVAHHHLSAGYDAWQDTVVRGLYRQSKHLWGVELLHADRFSENGSYVGLQDSVELTPDWRVSLGYGTGEKVNWLPRYRVDGFVHYTWGAQRNWVTHIGAGEYRAHDEHRDRWQSLGLSAYMDSPIIGPWVAEAEVRRTRSDPGQVSTRQQFVALTWGQHRIDQITWRHGWGREGWQAVGDARLLVNFASRQDTLTWQHWIAPDWGLRLAADHYRNDLYRRTGLNFGVFKEFQ